MPVEIKQETLDLATRVDELGKQGLTQEQIAQRLDRKSKFALRHELMEHGFDWESENRVRFQANHQRLEDLVAAGELVPAARLLQAGLEVGVRVSAKAAA